MQFILDVELDTIDSSFFAIFTAIAIEFDEKANTVSKSIFIIKLIRLK